MSGGSTTTTMIPELSPEQRADMAARTKFFTGVMGPQYQEYAKGLNALYNAGAGGVNTAAQNLAGTAAQAQSTLGGTGESALRTGISGLQNLFSDEYLANQIQAGMMPAQAQYQTNLANQNAMFGGANQGGSLRNQLSAGQLAGQNAAAQYQAMAQILKDVNTGRAGAAQSLAQLGQSGLTGALGAAGTGLNASMIPMQFANQYGAALGLVPGATFTPNFQGTQGSTTDKMGFGFGRGFSF